MNNIDPAVLKKGDLFYLDVTDDEKMWRKPYPARVRWLGWSSLNHIYCWVDVETGWAKGQSFDIHYLSLIPYQRGNARRQ